MRQKWAIGLGTIAPPISVASTNAASVSRRCGAEHGCTLSRPDVPDDRVLDAAGQDPADRMVLRVYPDRARGLPGATEPGQALQSFLGEPHERESVVALGVDALTDHIPVGGDPGRRAARAEAHLG